MPKNKYETVADQILEEIKNGQWKAGSKLPSEGQLMDRYNVSRVTLREALKKLNTLGIVRIVQGDGTYVERFNVSNYMEPLFSFLAVDEKSIEDVYEARIYVESGLAELAARRRTEQHVRQLSHLISRMEEEVAFNNYAEYSRYDAKFHTYVYNIAGNQLFIMMADMFHNITMAYTQRLNQNSKIVERSMMAHRQIYYAIEDQDEEYAGICMKHHLEVSKRQLLRMGI